MPVLDPEQLRSFVAVARHRSFTSAARALSVQQSTISQRVRRLEAAVARQLFVRDTHSVTLTADGEAMLGFASSLLEMQETAIDYFAASQLRGSLRLGASEDFVATELPEILRRFRRSHPLVDLQLTVALSGMLHEQLERHELDVVLAKRRGGGTDGQRLWREQLTWIGAPGIELPVAEPLPLVCLPPPSVTRELALAALADARRPWRAVCTSTSLSGITAALTAGLGVTAFVRGLVPPGTEDLSGRPGLPPLEPVEFVLRRHPATDRNSQREVVDALVNAIVANAHELR